MTVNEQCSRLHTMFNQLKRHKFQSDEISSLNFTGVYLIFEKGELAHSGDRIVRIGTTTGKNTVLSDRLFEHYKNKGRSVFRNHVALCLLNKNGDAHNLSKLFFTSSIERKNWEKTAKMQERSAYNCINEEVSKHIRENCSFAVFPDSRNNCSQWEKKLISTISTCTICKQSNNWLGKYIPKERKKIREYGLWNIQHTNSKNLMDDADVSEIESILQCLLSLKIT